ncbi:MAG: alpha/beta fold hydrolase [Spirochaetia bacterium]
MKHSIWILCILITATVSISCAGSTISREQVHWYEYSRFADADGTSIHYLDIGSRDSSLILLYLHGYNSCNIAATYFLEYFDDDIRIIIPDLPGCGYSDKPNIEYTTEYFVDTLHIFVSEIGLDRFVILGHSMGGQIAAAYACEHQNDLQGLILMAPLGMPGEIGGMYEFLSNTGPLVNFAYLFHNRWFYQMALETNVFYDRENIPSELAPYVSNWLFTSEGIRSLVSITKHLIGREYVNSMIDTITLPVLLIWGVDDDVLPYRYSGQFMQQLQNARLISYDNCGHMPQVERGRDTARAVSAYVRRAYQEE